MNRATIAILILGALAHLAAWAWVFRAHDLPNWQGSMLAGVSFSPYGRDQSPEAGDPLTHAEIARDLDLLQDSVGQIRTYSALGGLQAVPPMAAQHGLSVTAGAWIGEDADRNRRELDSVVDLARRGGAVERILVGNEALLRDDVSEGALIAAIAEVRDRTGAPVGTAEPWHVWLARPGLAAAVDFIGVQLLPYWEGVPVDEAVPYLLRRLAQVEAAYPRKPVVVTEVGWPSAGRPIGGARAGRVEQAGFLRDFLNAAGDRDFFVIEAFDQPWKIGIEGLAGAYWGLFDTERQPKFPWTGPVRERDDWLNWALLAILGGLLAAWVYARRRPALRPQGAMLLALVAQSGAGGLAWALMPPLSLYLSAAETAVWALLFVACLILIAGVLADAFEAIDLIWTGPLRRRFAPATAADGPFPKVTIHVPVRNEPPAMARQTLRALARLDYPDFEVVVLDNNTDDPALWQPVAQQCRALGRRFRFHRYPTLGGHKAGALNRALAHSAPDAKIVAVIDSDYVVERGWLKALAPLFDDPAIGLVQAPQDYRDRPQSLFKSCCFWEYAGFFRIGMVRRNEADAIIQHGTMCLIRRKALEDTGGWAEWCITEDAELGLRLASQGWRSAYVAESFGRGLTPDSLAAYKAQRFRWTYGAMQILKRRRRLLLRGGEARLTRAQRLHYLAGWLPWMADAAGLLFTIAAIGWTAALTAAPESTELPPAAFLIPPLAAFAFGQWRLFRLYGRGATVGDRTKAALAGLALSHTVAKAVIAGLCTARYPFLRTPKECHGPALLRGLAMASEEALMLGALTAAAAGFTATNDLWHSDAWLWLAVLVVMALPYAATVVLAAINAWPEKADRRARLGGVGSPVPAFPPSERRRKRKQ